MTRLLITLVFAAACAGAHAATDITTSFESWAAHYNVAANAANRKAFAATAVRLAQRNANEGPNGAVYGHDADSALTAADIRARACYSHPADPTAGNTAPLSFTPEELAAATEAAAPAVDWRKRGAVTPVQQQHPFGTCWAFAMTAATEGIAVVQGKKPLTKLAEQMTISCVPAQDGGADSNVLWKSMYEINGGRFMAEEDYAYNRTCNFFREELLAPDGKRDGYTGKCPFGGVACMLGRCPCEPCAGSATTMGTPPCHMSPKTSKFTPNARVSGWSFIGAEADGNMDKMAAGIMKYGPAQIGIDASCVHGYKSGVISNCTSTNVDHAVTLVGLGTEAGIPYWIVKNSWNYTFGDEGYFRMARNTNPPQMGVNGAFFGCFAKDCNIDGGNGTGHGRL